MAELSSIFSKKLFPHYKTSYFREKSPLQADFPAVQRVGVSLFFLQQTAVPEARRSDFAPHQPQVRITCQHGGQRKGHADAQEVAGGDGLAVFAQNANGRDISRSTDGDQVSAQRCTGEQAAVAPST